MKHNRFGLNGRTSGQTVMMSKIQLILGVVFVHYAIIEDLESDRQYLSDLIHKNPPVGEDIEISCYPDGESFLAEFRDGRFSAVFLDILLGHGKLTGIETAIRIREAGGRLPIIFTTTEPDFALAGYQVHPLDYLLKPVQPEKLDWCLKELRESLAVPVWFEVPVSSGQGAAASSRRVLLDDLLYAEAIRHGLTLYTLSGAIDVRLSLTELSALLPGSGRFYMSGRGHLVNFSQISSIENSGEILFKNGSRLFCSRRRLRETQLAFRQYMAAQSRNISSARRFLAEHRPERAEGRETERAANRKTERTAGRKTECTADRKTECAEDRQGNSIRKGGTTFR